MEEKKMKMKMKMKFLILMAGAVGFSLLSTAQAATVTLSAAGDMLTPAGDDFRGAWNSPVVLALGQPQRVIGNSYQARTIGDGGIVTGIPTNQQATRNYFLFGGANIIPDLGAPIASAQLIITHPAVSYDSPDPTETLTFFDVSTPGTTLQFDATTGNPQLDSVVHAALFDDLGSGSVFGSFTADINSNGTTEVITLNAAALASLNAAVGGEWAIGGAITSGNQTDFNVIERIFRGSDETGGNPQPATQLVLSTVPIPAAVWLFGSGLVGLVGIARRRRSSATV